LTFALATGPAHGTLVFNADGTYSYTAHRQPTVGFVAADHFTFVANDGLADSASATIIVILTPVNDAPTAFDLSLTVREGAFVAGRLPYTDPDGDPATFHILIGPQYGTLLLDASGGFVYQALPQSGAFQAWDRIVWQADDGEFLSGPAEILVQLQPRPVAAEAGAAGRGPEGLPPQTQEGSGVLAWFDVRDLWSFADTWTSAATGTKPPTGTIKLWLWVPVLPWFDIIPDLTALQPAQPAASKIPAGGLTLTQVPAGQYRLRMDADEGLVLERLSEDGEWLPWMYEPAPAGD